MVTPSDPARDLEVKLAAYERTGLPEYWIVDPEARTVTVYRLDGDTYAEPVVVAEGQTLQPRAPAGFALEVADLFAAP